VRDWVGGRKLFDLGLQMGTWSLDKMARMGLSLISRHLILVLKENVKQLLQAVSATSFKLN
jgi:hypothetical protein